MPFLGSVESPCVCCYDVYKCPHCPEYEFETAGALITHLKKSFKHKSQTKYTTFTCLKCNTDFETRRGFIHHLQQKRIHVYDLHQAACCGRFQDVTRLIQNENADKTGKSHIVKTESALRHRGMTPMHCAAFRGYTRCLRIMLSWDDGNPNKEDEFGQTPVHLAAKCGKATTLRLLLSKGGKVDLEDRDGMTPIKLATDRCIDTIIQHKIAALIDKQISKFFMRRMESLQCQHGQQNLAEIEEVDTEDDSYSEEENDFPADDSVEESVAIPSLTRAESCIADNIADVKERDVSCSSAMVERNTNVIVQKQQGGQVSQVSSDLLPYEIIARGEGAIAAFKNALAVGTSSASRLKIIVVGDVRAGKTSLIRSLSGQPFIETREKTHGIQTTSLVESIVQHTELNTLWTLADAKESHLDRQIARVVSKTLKEKNEVPKRQMPELPPSPGDFDASQIMASMGLSTPPRQIPDSQVLITQPSIPVEGSPRKLPASLIAKSLLSEREETADVKVNVWDFAGHQLYEPMHHLFMNSRSLYLVVFNLHKMFKSPEKSLCGIQYWLNSIASHTTAGTPIILVGTHKAQVDPDYIKEASELCKKHFALTFGPRLVSGFNKEIVFAVENSEKEEEGVSNLRSVIKNEASRSFPFVNEKLPLQWLHCEEEIIKYRQSENSKMCQNLNEFKTLLEEKCLVEFADDDFRSMVSFFHDSGLILLPGSMCGVQEGSVVKDLVILSPQYLVDIMTSIYDVSKDRNFKRQFSDEFHKLESEGRIQSHVLEQVWKDKDVNAGILVELLSCFNILYPLFKEEEKEISQYSGTEYIIPCMLKSRSDKRCEKRWKKACERWKDETDKERQFVFDFGRFLPPALFHYLLVHIYRQTCKTKAIKPTIERHTAIFSFSNQSLFCLKLVPEHCQIWVYSRCKKGKNFLELARILRENVFEICQQYFKYLKFIFGPPCPNENCPGATFDADCTQRPCESSSSESEGNSQSSDESESGTEENIKQEATGDFPANQSKRRPHVIPINPDSFDPPYWCTEVDLSEDLKDWNLAFAACDETSCDYTTDPSQEEEVTDSPTVEEECVEECCLDLVAEILGKHWKDLGRKLHLKDSEIQNISADSSEQKEHGFQVLMKWKNRQGKSASVRELASALEQLQLSNICDKLNEHFLKESHSNAS